MDAAAQVPGAGGQGQELRTAKGAARGSGGRGTRARARGPRAEAAAAPGSRHTESRPSPARREQRPRLHRKPVQAPPTPAPRGWRPPPPGLRPQGSLPLGFLDTEAWVPRPDPPPFDPGPASAGRRPPFRSRSLLRPRRAEIRECPVTPGRCGKGETERGDRGGGWGRAFGDRPPPLWAASAGAASPGGCGGWRRGPALASGTCLPGEAQPLPLLMRPPPGRRSRFPRWCPWSTWTHGP